MYRLILIQSLAFFAIRAAVAQEPPADTASKPSALAGVIRDTLGRPIRLATVLVEGRDLATVSDDSGRFHLALIPHGVNAFTVMRIGYRPLSFETKLAPDTTLVIAVQLRPVQTLDQIEVTAGRVSFRLARTGFYSRRRLGLGSFLSPERIDSLSHVTRPSLLLRDVRGIELSCSASRCIVQTRMPPHCLVLFVDGAYSYSQIDEVLTTGGVAAIEVYERPSLVPAEFYTPLPPKSSPLTVKAGCGAIVVWTRARTGQ